MAEQQGLLWPDGGFPPRVQRVQAGPHKAIQAAFQGGCTEIFFSLQFADFPSPFWCAIGDFHGRGAPDQLTLRRDVQIQSGSKAIGTLPPQERRTLPPLGAHHPLLSHVLQLPRQRGNPALSTDLSHINVLGMECGSLPSGLSVERLAFPICPRAIWKHASASPPAFSLPRARCQPVGVAGDRFREALLGERLRLPVRHTRALESCKRAIE